jgi:hypothetical protein
MEITWRSRQGYALALSYERDHGIKNLSLEFKTIECIDSYHILIIEKCCMDESDSINNGYNTKQSVPMFDLYSAFHQSLS